jgi:galactose oxidase
LPHTLTITMGAAVPVGGLAYLPRPAPSVNGRIGRYTIQTSTNGTNWTARVTNARSRTARRYRPWCSARDRAIRAADRAQRGRQPRAVEQRGRDQPLGPSGRWPPRRGTGVRRRLPAGAGGRGATAQRSRSSLVGGFAPDAFSGGRGRTGPRHLRPGPPAGGHPAHRHRDRPRHVLPGHLGCCRTAGSSVTGWATTCAKDQPASTTPATDAWTTGPAMRTRARLPG